MYDIVVIGGGPAGLTSAIYGARAGKKVILFEKKVCGGQIVFADKVENYPGFTQISGAVLVSSMLEQAEKFGVEIQYDEVKSIQLSDNNKIIKTASGEVVCHSIIIASGAKCRKAGFEGEEKYTGRGVSYCGVCDGAFFRNKDVAVIGGGSTAVADGIYLAGICNKVYMIHRRDTFRSEEILTDRLKEFSNVEFIMNSVPVKAEGDNIIQKLSVRKVSQSPKEQEDKEVRMLEVDGIFVAVGRIPDTEEFGNVVRLTPDMYFDAGEDCRTSVEGIYAAGDCRNKDVRQLTTAVSDGTVAALKAVDYCNNLK